jgi:hypothetical protein
MKIKLACCLGFYLLASIANAACPAPLQGAQSGWFVESFGKNAAFDEDKLGLISPPPINAMNLALPTTFQQLHLGAEAFPNTVLMARVRICEAGSYEFYTFIQRVRPFGPSPKCRVTTRVNGSRIAEATADVYNDLFTLAGRLSLEPGWAEVRLSLSCDGNAFLRFHTKYLANIYLAARVRGPNDNLQRDFAPGEVVNLGRATLSSQANPPVGSAGASPVAPPPVVAPAPVPEHRPQRTRQNLQFN